MSERVSAAPRSFAAAILDSANDSVNPRKTLPNRTFPRVFGDFRRVLTLVGSHFVLLRASLLSRIEWSGRDL